MKYFKNVILALFLVLYLSSSVFAAETPIQTFFEEFGDLVKGGGNEGVREGISAFLLIIFFYAFYFVALKSVPIFKGAKPARVVVSIVLGIFSTFGLYQLMGSANDLWLKIVGDLLLLGLIILLIILWKTISNSKLNGFAKFFLYILALFFVINLFTTLDGAVKKNLDDPEKESILGKIHDFLTNTGILTLILSTLFFIIFIAAPIAFIVWGISKLVGKFQREEEGTSGDKVRRAIEKIDEESAKVDSMFNSLIKFIEDKEKEVRTSSFNQEKLSRAAEYEEDQKRKFQDEVNKRRTY